MTTATSGEVIVWGNCQAPPIAQLLRGPLAAHGLTVLDVPTVFEATEEQVAQVRDAARRAAVLVTQPIRDEYRFPGCGSEQLAALLPAGGRVVRVPSAFHTGWFPYQANAHDETGVRVSAPLVEYHDLRLLAAAAAGRSAADVLAAWPVTASPEAIVRSAAASVAELRRREEGTDVTVSDLVDAPDAMFALNHPSNRLLAAMAGRVAAVLGVDADIVVPEREFVGAVRTPVEPHVVAARGAGTVRPDWRVGGRDVAWAAVIEAHLALYASRPGIVEDAWERWAPRFETLGI